MRGVDVFISVCSNPAPDSCEEVCVAVVVDLGDHIEGRMTTSLRLPEIVAPIVIGIFIRALYRVDNGRLLAVCIVEPIGTTGSHYENVLVFRLRFGLSRKHLLCLEQLAVEVGAA